MKKIAAASLLFVLLLTTSYAYSETNMPGAPSFGTPKNVSSESPSSVYQKGIKTNSIKKNTLNTISNTNNNEFSEKSQLDSIALSMLKAAENHDNSGLQSYAQKLMKKGVTSICQPQIIAKQTPQCPAIKIQVNGRNLSGDLCALTCYDYNGKTYDVGYCK